MSEKKHPDWSGQQGPVRHSTAGFHPTHRHYKGGLYMKLYDAYREASVAPLVVYMGEDGVVWTRPREDFEAVVDKKSKLLRFTPL